MITVPERPYVDMLRLPNLEYLGLKNNKLTNFPWHYVSPKCKIEMNKNYIDTSHLAPFEPQPFITKAEYTQARNILLNTSSLDTDMPWLRDKVEALFPGRGLQAIDVQYPHILNQQMMSASITLSELLVIQSTVHGLWDQIMPITVLEKCLYMGSLTCVSNKAQLVDLNVKFIVGLACPMPIRFPGFEYETIPYDGNARSFLTRASAVIIDGIQKGPVIVCCTKGFQYAPLGVMMTLLNLPQLGMTYAEAYDFVGNKQYMMNPFKDIFNEFYAMYHPAKSVTPSVRMFTPYF
jgi:hypothetical protein